MFSQPRHQFLDTSQENLILWIFYFGIQQLCTYFPVYLSNRRLRVCIPATSYISLPVPFATTSHLLDLIEFFPEEEMFPPNESVEILHSDKHDPIFRLIKESFSLSFLRAFVAPFRSCGPPFPRSPFFSFHDFRLYLKCFPIKHSIFLYIFYSSRACICLKVTGLNFYKLFNLINLDILLLNTFSLQLKSCNLLSYFNVKRKCIELIYQVVKQTVNSPIKWNQIKSRQQFVLSSRTANGSI